MQFLRSMTIVTAMAFACEANAAEIRVFTTGAPKQVVQIVADAFTSRTGHTITFIQDTAGGLRRRVEAGEAADVIVATPEVLKALADGGRVAAGTQVDFARTGVGIGVVDGAPSPDISSVDAIKALLVATPSVALPDPKAGGTSAVYLEALFKRLGMADIVAPKAKLKAGGYAADLVASGDAVLVFHQISEIKPVKGVRYVGPLPAEIQLTTTYSAALFAKAAPEGPHRDFIADLAGAPGRGAAEKAGMDPVR